VPSPAARHILRDDLLAQLLDRSRPLTGAELRARAPHLPVPGLKGLWLPLPEQVYRALCSLQRGGLITRVTLQNRRVLWSASPQAAKRATAEIVALETLFATPSHTGARPRRLQDRRSQ
jgi:DNA-binding PadR family transcriptional regulator